MKEAAGPGTASAASELDLRDPFSAYAAEFGLDRVYLDGNSLGPLPGRVQRRLREVVDIEWGRGLIGSWLQHDWINLPERVGARIARLIGAHADEVVVGNSTSVNLFNVAASALGLKRRSRIITDGGNFPTDLYVLDGLDRLLGRRLDILRVAPEEIEAALDSRCALVVLSHVDYRTSALLDMRSITMATHRAGACVLWDLSHSVGAVPVDLSSCEADFAVGCTYKYLNGGPGSPAFTYVARRWHDRILPAISGWQGHVRPFDFDPGYSPAAGIKRMLISTPEVLALSALDASISLYEGLDIEAVRAKSISLSEFFIHELERRCGRHGFAIVSPRDPQKRGSHVAVAHEHAYGIVQALIERGIVGDFRTPNLMRFAFAPLYQRHADIDKCVAALEEVMERRAWDDARFRSRASIT